jgi:Flp pilus assembly pilin Flp
MSPINKPRRVRRPRAPQPPQARQTGQAYTEYVVIVLLVVVVLIAGDNSVIAQLLAAFKSFYQAYSYTLSMP